MRVRRRPPPAQRAPLLNEEEAPLPLGSSHSPPQTTQLVQQSNACISNPIHPLIRQTTRKLAQACRAALVRGRREKRNLNMIFKKYISAHNPLVGHEITLEG